MTRTESLLLAQVLILAIVSVGILFAFSLDSQRTLGLTAPLTLDVPVDEGHDGDLMWVPVEQLEYIIGPWRTSDGSVLVSVSARGELAPQMEAPSARWRLTVESQGTLACGVYDGLQRSMSTPDVVPWRLGYCRGFPADPSGPASAVRITVLRSPGHEQIRLLIGSELDVELFQVQ